MTEYSSQPEPLDYREIESWEFDDDVSPKSQPIDRKNGGGSSQAQTEYNQKQLAEINEIPMLDEPLSQSPSQYQQPQQHQYPDPHQDSYQDPYEQSYQPQAQPQSQQQSQQQPQQQQEQQYQQQCEQQPQQQQQQQQQYQQPQQQQQQQYQQDYQQDNQRQQSPPIVEPAQLIENGIQPMDHAQHPYEYESWHDEDDISPMSHPVDRRPTGMSNQTQPPDPTLEDINSIPMLDDPMQQNSAVPIINPPHPATYSQQPTTYDPQPATYNQQQTNYNQQQLSPPYNLPQSPYYSQQQSPYDQQQNNHDQQQQTTCNQQQYPPHNQPQSPYDQQQTAYNNQPSNDNGQQAIYDPQTNGYSQQTVQNEPHSQDHMQEPEIYDSWHHGEVSPRSIPADKKTNGYFPDNLGGSRTPLEANTPLEARTPLEPRTPMEVQQNPLEDLEKIPGLDIATTEYSTEPELDTPIQHKFSVTSEMDQFSDTSSYSEPDEMADDSYKNDPYRPDLSDDDDEVETPMGIEAFTAMRKQRPERIDPFMLTHPNGVSIFPTLTTTEQEELSKEALDQAEEQIIVDSADTSFDSKSDAGYESDEQTARSTSMESTVRDYMYENGRRYHRFREGTYNFPNDDVEQEREDMKHAMVKLLCSQKLHFAPLGDHPQEVLDIGTGTGIWPIEMGDQYASANVLGVDLSPIQPEWVPPNVRFMIDDVESAWLYPRNSFDYIHARHTVMAIKDWKRLFRRAYEHLRPGGWMELQEIHHRPSSAGPNPLPADNPVAHYWSLINEGLASLGVNLHAAAGGRLAAMMQEVGFVNVTERVLHIPIGTWPKNKVLKTAGLYWRTILQDGIQAIALGPLTRGLGWGPTEVELLLVEVRKAYNDNSTNMYMPLHIIYGQKPIDARL